MHVSNSWILFGIVLLVKKMIIIHYLWYCYFLNLVLFALAWRFEPTIAVVLFGVLRSVLAMVGVVAKVVIKIKIDITNGFGIWLF